MQIKTRGIKNIKVVIPSDRSSRLMQKARITNHLKLHLQQGIPITGHLDNSVFKP
jgi:hypothetical protein